MFKRYKESEWAENICEDLTPVLEFLKTELGVQVKSVGLENVKAPDTVITLEGGLPQNAIGVLEGKFSSNPNLRFNDKWVACHEHYSSIE